MDQKAAVEGQKDREATTARVRRSPSSSRIRYTAKGPVRLTPTEAQILAFIERHEGHPISKAQLAAALGRNEKTISRLLSRLRGYRLLVSEPAYAENGAQLANSYRLASPEETGVADDREGLTLI